MPGFGEGWVQGLQVGGNLVTDVARIRLAQRQQDALLPIEQQLGQLDIANRKYDLETIKPLEEAIAQLQLQGERRSRRLEVFNAKRQAQMEQQFPALPFLQAMPGEAIRGITTLTAMQKEFENQSALIDQQAKADQEIMDRMKSTANEAKALKFDVATLVGDTMDRLEAAAPGLSFTGRERAYLADLAAQQVDAGAISPDDLPAALQQFLGNHPRVLGRLSALPDEAPAAPGAAPASMLPSAIQRLQALSGKAVGGVNDALALMRAQQAAAAEAKTAQASQKKRGVLEWISRAAAGSPDVAAAFLQQQGIADQAALEALDLDALESLQSELGSRIRLTDRANYQRFGK